MKRGELSNFLLAAILILHAVLLPFVLFWVLAKRMVFNISFIKDEISVEFYRFTDRIKCVNAYSNRNMARRLDKMWLARCIDAYRKNSNAKNFDINLTGNKNGVSFNASFDELHERLNKSIISQWKDAKSEGGCRYVILADSGNKLKLMLHNDAGVWLSAEFNGQNDFLRSVKSELAKPVKA